MLRMRTSASIQPKSIPTHPQSTEVFYFLLFVGFLSVQLSAALISPPATEFLIMAEGKLTLSNHVEVAGSIGTTNKFIGGNNLALEGDLYARSKALVGKQSQINGSILADSIVRLATESQSGAIESDKVFLKKNTVVTGDIQYGIKLSKHKTAAIIGEQTGPIQLSRWQQPLMDWEPMDKLIDVENQIMLANTETNLDPGEYNLFKVKKNSTVFLTAGDYYFNDMTLSKGALVIADTRQGDINIYVSDDFHSSSDVTVGNVGEGNLNMAVGDKMTVGPDNFIYANLVAWDDIRIKKRSLISGTILGKDKVKIDTEVRINPEAQFFYSLPEVPEPAAVLFLGVGSIIIFSLHGAKHRPTSPRNI